MRLHISPGCDLARNVNAAMFELIALDDMVLAPPHVETHGDILLRFRVSTFKGFRTGRNSAIQGMVIISVLCMEFVFVLIVLMQMQKYNNQLCDLMKAFSDLRLYSINGV